MESLIKRFIDITEAKHCDIQIREDGKVIWINVEGVCVCRVCRIEELRIIDDRRELSGI